MSGLLILISLFSFSQAQATDKVSSTLLAGFAASDITPPTGVPLAGYGGGERRLIPWDVFDRYPYATFLHPSKGKLDPIRAKVMLLSDGTKKVLLMSLDLVAFTAENRLDLIRRIAPLGFNDMNVFISATHTHSGPGTLSKNLVWEVLASDRFNPSVYDSILEEMAFTVFRAHHNLKPARIKALSVKTHDLQKNRRLKDGPLDPIANLILAESPEGLLYGSTIHYAIHGTALKPKNLKFSSDVPGAIEREIEEALDHMNLVAHPNPPKPIALFINSAEGDVTPIHGQLEGIRDIASRFRDQVLEQWNQAETIDATTWSIRSSEIKIGVAALNIKGCVDNRMLRTLLMKKLPLAEWFPTKTKIWSMRLGPIQWMTWPGEPTTEIGNRLKSASLKHGIKYPIVMGLTNDYLAYWTTPQEFLAGGYESCNSLYGKWGGFDLIQNHKTMLAHF